MNDMNASELVDFVTRLNADAYEKTESESIALCPFSYHNFGGNEGVFFFDHPIWVRDQGEWDSGSMPLGKYIKEEIEKIFTTLRVLCRKDT